MTTENIKATASDAYELLTSQKMGATLYYDRQDDELVVSSNVPSDWHKNYTQVVSREDAINWMGDDFQGDESEPTDLDCQMVADWINENLTVWMAEASREN